MSHAANYTPISLDRVYGGRINNLGMKFSGALWKMTRTISPIEKNPCRLCPMLVKWSMPPALIAHTLFIYNDVILISACNDEKKETVRMLLYY